jgi:glycosyltransferase involved in cell wall biosynthesis
MKILFLSHKPHEVHLEFAKSINAQIKIIHLNWFVKLAKKFYFFNFFYPLISLFYSFLISSKEDFILVDGGSSLYSAIFLKIRHPRIKIILLDGDLFFYKAERDIQNKSLPSFFYPSFFYNKIDAIISVSEQNRERANRYVTRPIKVSTPYPKNINKIDTTRKNYGLYIGRLDPEKNIDRIINFGLQCPYFEKFIVVGDGTYRDRIKQLSSINPKIVYINQTKEIDNFLNKCKFFVHIPDYDPHPCTTMEAALAGCFPILSKGVGTNYLFDKFFIIDNPNNFQEINSKIKYILDHEDEFRNRLKYLSDKFPNKTDSINNFRNKFYELMNIV